MLFPNTAVRMRLIDKIDDALNKLKILNLVTETDGQYKAVSIQQGIKILDQRWDDYYRT